MKGLILFCVIGTCVCLFDVSLGQADVWFVEAEDFDPDTSILENLGKWMIKDDDKKALGKGKYMTVQGANRNNCEACSPLHYPIPNISQAGLYKLWSRCIMPTTGSDSFFWQVSNDGGKKFTLPVAAHGGAQWVEWQWKRPWDGISLKKGKDNVLIIAERENNPKLDTYCLRNDNQIPTDDEALQWFEDHPKGFAVEPQQKLPMVWAQIKALR